MEKPKVLNLPAQTSEQREAFIWWKMANEVLQRDSPGVIYKRSMSNGYAAIEFHHKNKESHPQILEMIENCNFATHRVFT